MSSVLRSPDQRPVEEAVGPAPALPAAAPLPDARPRRQDDLWPKVLLPVACIVLSALMLRATAFFPSAIDPDEGLYALQAREWLRGGWPFIAVWDMHPVGAPALIAIAMAVFGESIFVIRMLGAGAVAATGLGLYALARAGHAPRVVGLGAALIYVGHSVLFGGLATNTEILFAPFVCAAMAVAVDTCARTLRNGHATRWREIGISGLLIGVALTIKPVTAPEGCLVFALLVGPGWWRGTLPTGQVLVMAVAYAVICVAPTAAFALAYALHGGLDAFIEGTLLAPLRYAEDPIGALAAARKVLSALFMLAWPCALAAAAFVPWRGAQDGARPTLLLTRIGLAWLLVAGLASAAPGKFYPHYFLIWLPPLSLLAALGARRLARNARRGRGVAAFVVLVGAVALSAWTGLMATHFARGFGFRLADPARQIARSIAPELTPGEPIYVVNYHPIVYFLANAGVPTRYAFAGHLVGGHNAVTGIDSNAELARVLALRPRFIVVDRGQWDILRPEAATAVTRALAGGYTLANTVAGEYGPVETWRRR